MRASADDAARLVCAAAWFYLYVVAGQYWVLRVKEQYALGYLYAVFSALHRDGGDGGRFQELDTTLRAAIPELDEYVTLANFMLMGAAKGSGLRRLRSPSRRR